MYIVLLQQEQSPSCPDCLWFYSWQPSGKRNKVCSACWRSHSGSSNSSHKRCATPTWRKTPIPCTTRAPSTSPPILPRAPRARLPSTAEAMEGRSLSTVRLWLPCTQNTCLGPGLARPAPTSTFQGAPCARAVAWSTLQVSVLVS